MIYSADFELHSDLVRYMCARHIHKENVIQITHTWSKIGYDVFNKYTLFYEV